MILSHRAPSSLNMSSYRAIWIHFKPNSRILIQKYVVFGLVLDQVLVLDHVLDQVLVLNLVLDQVLVLDLNQVLDLVLDESCS